MLWTYKETTDICIKWQRKFYNIFPFQFYFPIPIASYILCPFHIKMYSQPLLKYYPINRFDITSIFFFLNFMTILINMYFKMFIIKNDCFYRWTVLFQWILTHLKINNPLFKTQFSILNSIIPSRNLHSI